MNLTINKAKLYAEQLIQSGWQRLGNFLDVYPYYLRKNNECVAVGQIIPVRNYSNLQAEVDRYFRKIMKRHESYGLTRIIFFSSPDGISIPDYFREFCEQQGIVIEYREELNLG